jgi:hypothetical protein
LAASSSAPTGNLITATGALHVGHEDSWVNEYFKGVVDEVRVSNVARPADWILTEYSNQSAPGAFYSVGSQEIAGAPPPVTSVRMLPLSIVW